MFITALVPGLIAEHPAWPGPPHTCVMRYWILHQFLQIQNKGRYSKNHAMTAPTFFPRINLSVLNRAIKVPISKSRPAFVNCSYRYNPTRDRRFTTSSRFNMKEAIVAKGPKVTIHDVPIPKPGPSQVLIKVIYSGSNPKDWKRPQYGEPHNSGDDIAGIIEAVGDRVFEFKKGDRVAAFHEMTTPHGSFAEYAIAWDYTTFPLPDKTSFEEVPCQLKYSTVMS
jgi:hypothetical protein